MHKYIAIEGVIGAGKTSLAKLLEVHMKAKLILEPIEENPFLPKFYKDKKNYAFQTQLFFLLARYQQQQEIMQHGLFEENVITDYLFSKDRIFAYQNLRQTELVIYENLYTLLVKQIPTPNITIYLQASTKVLIERIRYRKCDYEKHLSSEYIDELNKAYNHFFFHYTASPLLVINTNNIDFVHNENVLQDLIEKINNTQHGTRYYIPK